MALLSVASSTAGGDTSDVDYYYYLLINFFNTMPTVELSNAIWVNFLFFYEHFIRSLQPVRSN